MSMRAWVTWRRMGGKEERVNVRHSATSTAPVLVLPQRIKTTQLVPPLTARQGLVIPTICGNINSILYVPAHTTDHQTASLHSCVPWTLARRSALSLTKSRSALSLPALHATACCTLLAICGVFLNACLPHQSSTTVSVIAVARPVTSQHASSVVHRSISSRRLTRPFAPRQDRVWLDPRSLAASAASPARHGQSVVVGPPTASPSS